MLEEKQNKIQELDAKLNKQIQQNDIFKKVHELSSTLAK